MLLWTFFAPPPLCFKSTMLFPRSKLRALVKKEFIESKMKTSSKS